MGDPDERRLAVSEDSGITDGWLHDRFCPVCGAENKPTNEHCSACGAALLPLKRIEREDVWDDLDGWLHEPDCQECGAENHPLLAHCASCGAALVPEQPLKMIEKADGWLHYPYCPSCKEKTDPMYAHCEHCGGRLNVVTTYMLGLREPVRVVKCFHCGEFIDPETSCCRACGKFQIGGQLIGHSLWGTFLMPYLKMADPYRYGDGSPI